MYVRGGEVHFAYVANIVNLGLMFTVSFRRCELASQFYPALG